MEKPTYQGQQPSKEREWPPDGVESPDGIVVVGMPFLKPIARKETGCLGMLRIYNIYIYIYVLRIKFYYYTHLYTNIFIYIFYIQFVVNHNKDPYQPKNNNGM